MMGFGAYGKFIQAGEVGWLGSGGGLLEFNQNGMLRRCQVGGMRIALLRWWVTTP